MNFTKLFRNLGPGLLYAGAAVGVSHLVQSTRAGASYGFDLIWILILANIIKYPFFEFAPRYATSTGKSLLFGYKKIGSWALWLYAILTVSTMFAITAAILIVTAGLFSNLMGINLPIQWVTLVLMILILIFLVLGRFKLLESSMKYIIILLSISTILAVIFSFKLDLPQDYRFNWAEAIDIAFLIAFIGWMPAPFDVSVWHSSWTVARQENQSEKISMKMALKDFNIGYIGTALLAIGFLSLGSFVMYGSGESFSAKGVEFAGQLIQMYTSSLGGWAYYIIGIAAFTTMLSTSITVMDAYPRVLVPTTRLLLGSKDHKEEKKTNRLFLIWALILVFGTWILMVWFGKSMKFMVDLATTISFVTAPLLAILNFWAVMSIDKKDRPSKFLQVFAWISMIFLTLFSIFYLIWKFV